MKPFCVFDIETTSLDDFGHLLAVTIGDINYGHDGTCNCVSTTLMLNDYPASSIFDDSELLRRAISELSKYSCVIGWYSKGFDARFLRRRLLYHRMPDWKPNLHLDLYYIYKSNFKTGEMSCRLQAAGEFLDLPDQKMTITRKVWKEAWYGNAEAMAKIKERCESDVRITASVFDILLPYIRPTSFKVA